MQLRTKIVLAFSAMLALVAVLGVTSYMSTENMNNYAVQSAYIENGKSAIEEAQTAYLHYAQSGDPKQAEQMVAFVKTAEQAFRSALPYMISPERKKTVEDSARNVGALEADVADLVRQQAAVRDTFAATDALFLKAATPYNALENGVAQMAREFVPDVNQLGYSGGENEIVDNLLGIFEIRLNLNRIRTSTAQLSTSTSREARDKLFAALDETMDKLKTRHDQLVAVNQKLLEDVIVNVDAYIQGVRQYADMLAVTGETQNNLSARMGDVKAQAQQLSGLATASVRQANSTANVAILVVCGLALLLGVFITYFLSGNVTRQLGKDPGELARIADRVAAGDFAVDDGSRAVGVYSNIIKMVAMLKTNIDEAHEQSVLAREESAKAQDASRAAQAASREAEARRDGILAAAERLETVVNVVSEASQSLSAQIEQSGHGADEQAARVTETATAMEEMNSTVLEVARNAGKASEFSAGTRQKAEAGAQVVQSAVDSIQTVKTQSEALRRDMDKLAENAQAITRIMNVISDIADQTNLLALNAAIEAARAGDAGRGFAVVADEVRNLAEKTMASTSDVAAAITAIQESVTLSAQQLDTAVGTINQATELAIQSGQALTEIVSMADDTADQVHSIATASEEQSATSEEITRSIAQVNEISTQTADAMRSAAVNVAELARQTQDLTGLVAEMRKN